MPHFSDWVDPTPDEPIEIVDSIELEGAIEVVPAPCEAAAEPVEAIAAPLEMVAEQADDFAELVEALSSPDTEVPVPLESGIVPSASATQDDPYGVFLRTLADVATESGHLIVVTEIASALADDSVARAWCAILRGESEDFTLCGTPLDEWASAKLGSILGAPHKSGQLRRELRHRGIAAFGLVEAA